MGGGWGIEDIREGGGLEWCMAALPSKRLSGKMINVSCQSSGKVNTKAPSYHPYLLDVKNISKCWMMESLRTDLWSLQCVSQLESWSWSEEERGKCLSSISWFLCVSSPSPSLPSCFLIDFKSDKLLNTDTHFLLEKFNIFRIFRKFFYGPDIMHNTFLSKPK